MISVFSTGGVSFGASAEGGVDVALGFDTSSPDEVGGVGVDLNIEVKNAIGGNISVSWDPSDSMKFAGCADSPP